MTHILMVAAENDALPGGKVGGIGDVVRDAPAALAARGCDVTVLTPAYGVFADLRGARRVGRVDVGFGGTSRTLDLYVVPGRRRVKGVRHWVLDHPLFSTCGRGRIYCDDPPERAFATDADKFALFCAAAAEAAVRGAFGEPDVIHLHDWHSALLLALRRYHPAYQPLRTVRCAYTIHNLALQGIRPFTGDPSSLAVWYPESVDAYLQHRYRLAPGGLRQTT